MTPIALPAGDAARSGLRRWLVDTMRRVRPALLVALPILLAAIARASAASAWRMARADATLARLAGGEDVAVATDAMPAVMLARVLFLARRDRLEEAEPLVETVERGDDGGVTMRRRCECVALALLPLAALTGCGDGGRDAAAGKRDEEQAVVATKSDADLPAWLSPTDPMETGRWLASREAGRVVAKDDAASAQMRRSLG